MSRRRQALGRYGERTARSHLERRGYTILESNYRTRTGEVDLVTEQNGVLAFVEVRTLRGAKLGSPEESITERKRSRLVALAQEYLQAHNIEDAEWRIDVVALELDSRGRLVRLDVIENAVEV